VPFVYCKFYFPFRVFIIVTTIASVLLGGCGFSQPPREVWGRTEAKEVDINSKIPGRVVEFSCLLV
jgi:HlyD family secretion protein